MLRRRSGRVCWVRHAGPPGDDFGPGRPLLPHLHREAADIVVPKTLNNSFAGTSLRSMLAVLAPDRVLIAGWATDFGVDATARSARLLIATTSWSSVMATR